MADESRPFVIDVKRRWLLAILPLLATIYFIAVIVLRVRGFTIEGVSDETLVYGGVGFFILVMLIELPFFLRRSAPRRVRPAKVAAQKDAAGEPSNNGHIDDEYVITEERQQGLQVLEYSAPPKSRNANAVYTKTYVAVSQAHVVRVETVVADATDI